MPSSAPPPPLSRRVFAVGATVLAMTIVAVVVDTRRVRTGELLIQSDRGDLSVTIRQGGRVVEGPTGHRSFTLRPGVYQVDVAGSAGATVSVVAGERSVMSVASPP